MKLLLVMIVLLIVGMLVTGSGALFQSTVEVGSGSIGVSVPPAPEEPDDDNTARTLAACRELADRYNACQNSTQRDKLGLKGTASTVNDNARKMICDVFDGEFLPLETEILADSHHLDKETLYIHPYFVVEGNKIKYIVLFTSGYATPSDDSKWSTNAVYFPATGMWYEYVHYSLHGLFYDTYPVSNFSRYSESTAQYILENGYTVFGTDWRVFYTCETDAE